MYQQPALAGNAPDVPDCQIMSLDEHDQVLKGLQDDVKAAYPNYWDSPNKMFVIGNSWTRFNCPFCGGSSHEWLLNWNVWYVFGPEVNGAIFNIHDGQLNVSKGWLKGELLSCERVQSAP